MTFPGMEGDIRLLANMAATDTDRNKRGEDRALDLIAAYEHMRRNMKHKTGENVFPEDSVTIMGQQEGGPSGEQASQG